MRITVISAGSRGDIQPYLALSIGLQRAGHAVRFCTHINFREWIESYGIEWAELGGNPKEMTESGMTQEWMSSGSNPIKFAKEFQRLMVPVMSKAMHDTMEASKGADLILPSALSYYAAYVAANELGIRWMQSFLQPIHPAAEFPSALIGGGRTYGGLLNSLSHYASGLGFWMVMRPGYNEVLKNMGIDPLPLMGVFQEVESARIPALYGFSPSLIPHPRAWAEHLHVTGFWFLNEGGDYTPPAELADFLQAGAPPVYVGFGSMANRDPEETTRLVVDALRKSGQRGIILTGWAGMEKHTVGDDILFIDSAPHDWLFPRVAAVVHHGGAGTTSAGLRAGKPTVTVPFFADQPWWGNRVYERGVGTKPIPRTDLTSDNLAAAIREALNGSGMRERASHMGELIRAEDGVGCAVKIIDDYLQSA